MAGELLILDTRPGRPAVPERGITLIPDAFTGVAFYRIFPGELETQAGSKIIPTPQTDLLDAIGQANIDAYVDPLETQALDNGNAGFEVFDGEKRVIREPDGTLRQETNAETIQRMIDRYPDARERFLTHWRERKRLAGTRINVT